MPTLKMKCEKKRHEKNSKKVTVSFCLGMDLHLNAAIFIMVSYIILNIHPLDS